MFNVNVEILIITMVSVDINVCHNKPKLLVINKNISKS